YSLACWRPYSLAFTKVRYGTNHVVIHLIVIKYCLVENAFKTVQRLFKTYTPAFHATEYFRGLEWLSQEALQASGTGDHRAVGCGKLFQPKHGNNIAQLFILRQSTAYTTRYIIVTLTNHGRG